MPNLAEPDDALRQAPGGRRRGMNARAERFPLFDGMRAIAALSVLVFHAAYVAQHSACLERPRR